MGKKKEKETEEKPKEEKREEKQKWFNKFFNNERLKKSNKVAVVFLRNNRLADFKEVEARNGYFSIEGKNYHVDNDCIYSTQKDRIPMAIIREWDLMPLGTKQYEDDEMRNRFAKLESHVLNGIKNAELARTGGSGFGNNLTNKQIILYAIIGIVAVALIVGYI